MINKPEDELFDAEEPRFAEKNAQDGLSKTGVTATAKAMNKRESTYRKPNTSPLLSCSHPSKYYFLSSAIDAAVFVADTSVPFAITTMPEVVT